MVSRDKNKVLCDLYIIEYGQYRLSTRIATRGIEVAAVFTGRPAASLGQEYPVRASLLQ